MYVTVDQVRADYDEPTFLLLFAIGGAGEVADKNPALQLAMMKAHAEMTSELATEYGVGGMPTELPAGPISTFLVTAELAYVKFFAFERKPATAYKISPTYLSDLKKNAQDRMDRLKHAIQEIAPNDNPPPAPPANVGGITTNQAPRMLSDAHTGRSNFGDF
jgi:hypothetical protein